MARTPEETERLLERAMSLMKLPKGKFVGINNVCNVLLGYATAEEIAPFCFDQAQINLASATVRLK